MKRTKHPWSDIRRLYVEGEEGEATGSLFFPTLHQVAERFGVGRTVVRRKAADGHWAADRADYQARLEAARREQTAYDRVKEIVDTDDRALSTARLGAHLVLQRVRDIEVEATTRAAAKAEWERLRDLARGGEAQAGPETIIRTDDVEGPAIDDAEAVEAAQRAADEYRDEITRQMAEIDYDPWAPPVVDARELSTLAAAAAAWHTLALKSLGESEVRRVEVSGPGGAPVQVQAATIYQELTRDDPSRLHSLMAAYGRAIFGVVEDDEPLALAAGDDGADPGDDPGDAA